MPVTVVVRSASPGPGGSAPRGRASRSPTGGGKPDDDPSLTFDGPRVVIGRGQGSDVRLPDPSISTRHATIRAHGSDYAVVDEGSTNGTWLGGVKLLPQTPRVVRSGDLVRVGRVWLQIAIGQKAPTPDLGLATRDLALALVRNAMAAAGDDTVAKLRVAEGPDLGAELRLVDEGRAYVIGRADKCDLPLADPDASREHAVVVRRGGLVLLRDPGSRNGVFLGGARVAADRDVVWRPPTMARIGATVLALDEPVSAALADLEDAPDEQMNEEDAPAPPAVPATAPPPPAEERPASQLPPAARAPIAEIPVPPGSIPDGGRTKRRAWTFTDALVVMLAVAVIGASLAGLVWVLR